MKNKLNIILGILVAFILIPQIALASWWNPFSWGWKKLFTPPAKQQIEIIEKNTESIEKKLSPMPDSTEPKKEIDNEKQSVKVDKPVVIENKIATPPVDTTYCNGIYWSKCATDQDFVCTANGNAYCQIHYQEEPKTAKSQPPNVEEQYFAPVSNKKQEEVYQKDTHAEDLLVEYNSKINAIDRDILDLYDEYAEQIETIMDQRIPMEFINAQVDKKKAERDQEIRSLDAKKQRLYLDYSSKINSLR